MVADLVNKLLEEKVNQDVNLRAVCVRAFVCVCVCVWIVLIAVTSCSAWDQWENQWKTYLTRRDKRKCDLATSKPNQSEHLLH